MTSGAPWSVKGIDPKAREVAKDLARRSGMTLGEWLNRVILEDEGPEEITSQTYFDERAERPDRPQFTPRLVEATEAPGAEPDRVAVALDRLGGGVEQEGIRKTPAAIAAEVVMRQAMARIEAAEREHVAVAARFEGAIHEARAENSRLAERLRRVEAEAAGPRSAEALRSLEAALGKIASHLHEGEGRTRETIAVMERRLQEIGAQDDASAAALIEEVVNRVDARLSDAEARTADAFVSLGQAFAHLDERVDAVDRGGAASIDRRLEDLAATLSQRVDVVREEIAEKLQASAEGRFGRMEQQLGEMAAHAAEQVSSEAIEKMGREVLTMADTLNRRVQDAEDRSADAIEQVGGEVARIAQAMEARFGRSEGDHAEALEKLGSEIAKITERLSERIGSSERRAAQAIDDVGEQVAQVSERLSQRQERSSEDLVERIRQSEERTARLLDEARAKVDHSLAESHRRLSEQALAATPAPRLVRDELASPFAADPLHDLGPAEPSGDPLALQAFAGGEAALAPEAEAPKAAPREEFETSVAVFPDTTGAVAFDAQDYEAADGFAPVAPSDEAVADDVELELAPKAEAPAEPEAAPAIVEAAEADVAEPADATPDATQLNAAAFDLAPPDAELEELAATPEPERPLTTREVIEQARAAARAASGGEGKKLGAKVEKLNKPASPSLFSNFGLRPKRVAGGSLQTALLVAGGAAFMSLAAAGFLVADGQPSGEQPQRVADALAVFESDKAGEIPTGEADTAPLAAVAIIPQPMSTVRPPVAATESAELANLYTDAVRAIETKAPGGLDSLRKAANLGHSPAQFYLAKLYENGEAGLKKDPAEARRWTERAAQGGNRHAMHNLGIALIEGKGGPKNATLAGQWFRRAADLGLVDSQYNLGALYEQGLGESQNAAEAYKWYLVAARTGDTEARKSAARVRAGLSPEARSVSERAAQGFRPTALNPSASGAEIAVAPAAAVVTAQRVLSRLGFYQGPMDGVSSPALTMAVAAYQREQGLVANGGLDQTTVSRLQVFTR